MDIGIILSLPEPVAICMLAVYWRRSMASYCPYLPFAGILPGFPAFDSTECAPSFPSVFSKNIDLFCRGYFVYLFSGNGFFFYGRRIFLFIAFLLSQYALCDPSPLDLYGDYPLPENQCFF